MISAPGEPYARMRPLGRDVFLVLTPNLQSIAPHVLEMLHPGESSPLYLLAAMAI
jgi:hypothetical protein